MRNLNFRSLNIDQKDILCEFLKCNRSISCEFCVGNLLTWNKVENTEYCVDKDILYLRNNMNGEINYYFPLIKCNSEEEIISALNDLHNFHLNSYGSQHGSFNLIHLTSEQTELLKKYYGEKFIVSTDRDRSEYIYEAEKFRTYSGKKLHKKRNHLNRFYSLYGESFRYEPIDSSNIGECIKLSCEWSKINRYYLNASMIEELDIVSEHFNNYEKLGLIGGCIRIGGDIKGFTIGEAAFEGSDTVVIHVEKAMYDIDGIYPALASHFLRDNAKFKYVNREDDVGDEGLRSSKLSYRPLYLLHKYNASAVSG